MRQSERQIDRDTEGERQKDRKIERHREGRAFREIERI